MRTLRLILRHGRNNPMPDNVIDNSVVERYAGLEGRDLITSILRDYPDHTALVSSFGAESAVLLHMVSEVDPNPRSCWPPLTISPL